MPGRFVIAFLTLLVSSSAFAGSSFGFGLGFAADLPDAAGKTTQFGGPGLHIPVRIGFGDNARLRLDARGDLGFGQDRVTWAGMGSVDGEPYRYFSDDHFSMLVSGAFTVGAEFDAPVSGDVKPFFGAGFGVAWVGTYHSFGDATQPLLADYTDDELRNSNTVDPFTTQLSPVSDIRAGVRIPVSDTVALNLDLGYSVVFLDAKPLKNTPAALDARREAYGWNALRIGVGMQFGL